MDYEKKNKAALNWMKDVYPTLEGAAKEDANHYFPELRESEDERIKRNIIAALKGVGYYDCDLTNECIAWVEKQGKQELIISDDALREGIAHFGITQYQIDNWLKKYVVVEKQGEQKSADKVEPKFHEGEWITDGYLHYKITDVLEDRYIVDTKFVKRSAILFEREHNYHLWTIQDAKPGDVLYHSDSTSNGIFIFKEIIDKKFAKEVICYCCDYDSEDHLCLGEHQTCCLTDAKILYPATKVLRDLLFSKMKEAGYEWDAEKKELKKIEQKPADKVEPKFHEGDWVILTAGELSTTLRIVNVDTNKKLYWFNDSSYLPIVDEECLHLWTIEDAKPGDVLVAEPIKGHHSPFVAIYKKQDEIDFDSYCFIGFDGKFYKGENGHYIGNVHPATKEQRDTLMKAMSDAGYTFDFENKELKKISQRMISAEAKEAMYDKPWSEEDKDFMYDTLSNLTELKDRYGEGYGNVGKCIDWLKSLSPQNRWKPSDEQLEAVRIAAEVGTANNSWAMDILKCIYQYLKKLREE